MTPAVFAQQFEHYAAAPDGIAKLRELVLQIAVRGKLVPQDPNDEPASELLRRIEGEKDRLVRVGEIKKHKPLPPLSEEETAYPLPTGWAWSRLDDYTHIVMGQSPPSSTYNDHGEGVPFYQGKAEFGDLYPTAVKWCTLPRKLAERDNVLISVRAPVGPTNISPERSCIGRGLAAIRSMAGSSEFYLLYGLRALESVIVGQGVGSTFTAISRRHLAMLPFPVAPAAEQQRIVAKVDALMKQCDELEAMQQQRANERGLVNGACLHRLTSPDIEPTPEAWQCVKVNFDELYDCIDTVSALRQSILQLAVQGKLVPQDPNDEPASELLKRIKAERDKLVRTGKLRKPRPLPPVAADDVPHGLPDSWEWARLGAAYDVRDGTHDTPKYVLEGYPLVTSKNLSGGTLSLVDTRLISEVDHRAICQRSGVDRDDILFAMIGSIGNPVLVDTDAEFSIKNVALLKYYARKLSCPRYLHAFLLRAAAEMRSRAAGGVQSFVSLSFLRRYTVPIPPLAEQKRIVAKVAELTRQCDELVASLNRRDDGARNLVAATVHHMTAAAS